MYGHMVSALGNECCSLLLMIDGGGEIESVVHSSSHLSVEESNCNIR